MANKAVFFDIDGTFLNDRKRVSSSTKKAISQMKEDGILVGLATGRGPGFVQPFMDNPRLNTNHLAADVHDPPEIARKVEHQPRT